MVLWRRRASEFVKTELEPVREPLLFGPHIGTVLGNGDAGRGGGQLRRSAVLVRSADEHDLMTARAHVAGIEVGGQLTADEIAQMLDSVDVGNR